MKNEIKVFTIENRSVIYFITTISTVTIPLVRVAISTKKNTQNLTGQQNIENYESTSSANNSF